jgi:transposase
MTPEKLFHDLLGLGLSWEVTESCFEHERGTVVLHLRETSALWPSLHCPKCSGHAFCYDHPKELVWRHLNVFEHRCELHCRLPRARCRGCAHTWLVRPPWEGLSTHFTKGFEAFALLLMREMPMSKVAEVTGETDTRLWRMLFRQVDAACAEADFSNVCCIGADELNIRKGHTYLTVFADLLAKRVLFATEGKDKETWARFIAALEAHNGHRHAITQASVDMSPAYAAGITENCRNAEIVNDKYHVVAQVNDAVDQVRKAEARSGDNTRAELLKFTRWIWRKNPENLTEKEQARLAELDTEALCTAKAYQLRLMFQSIYQEPTAGAARSRFQAWCRLTRLVARKYSAELLAPMVRAAGMVERHRAGILAHWKWGVTNAFMEGLNSLFQATKRKARGYRSPEYLITMLYFIAGKLRLPQF